MNHIKVTNLENVATVFEGKTVKKRRELLEEAALITALPMSKDRETAMKLSRSLRELAEEIVKESEELEEKLKAGGETAKAAAQDFVANIKAESARLFKLCMNSTKTEKKKADQPA